MAHSNNLTDTLKSDIASIAALRDHLLVQLDLAKLEVHDEWHELESKWHQVEDELRSMSDHAMEPIQEIGQAARTLIDELKWSYARIKSRILQ
jgi:hypothetical protein